MFMWLEDVEFSALCRLSFVVFYNKCLKVLRSACERFLCFSDMYY